MSLFFYNISTGAYKAAVHIASLWNKKAKLWVEGRKDVFEKLTQWRQSLQPGDKVVWMHCASLGEFEQGRPVAESLRQKYPDHKLLLTFFSPSGYEIRKNYAGADAVFYLPADSKTNASKFISIADPGLVIWVKYEYWYHYITGLKAKSIPVLLVSAIFRTNQPFFKWYGGIWKKMLKSFTQIFVQDAQSPELLKVIGITSNITVAGDTRFDRVIAIAEEKLALPEKILQFTEGFKVMVAGSTWEEDEEEIVHYARMHPQVKFIIAPHEIDEERLNDILKLFPRSVLYSKLDPADEAVQVVVIDNIGMLSRLYKVADVAYIGGGFNESGIHNILEAAVFGKPVIFGPEYEKFREAVDLVERQGAYSISNALELEALLDKFFANAELLQDAAAVTENYVYEKQGATAAVINYIYENRLLTN